MRTSLTLLLCCLLATPATAQEGGGKTIAYRNSRRGKD